MVRLVYSNDTGALLAELAERVRAQQLREGPLAGVRIVVPSLSTDAYVRFGISAACGIAANLEVSLLTRFASEVLAQATGTQVADAAAFEAMALEIFLDDAAMGSSDLASVRAYLDACGDVPEALDLRRVQLAAHIGRLFEAYTCSRAEMLTAWSDGTSLDMSEAETERWQRALWRAMFGSGGLAAVRARSALPAIGAFHELASSFDPTAAGSASALHVFALANLPRTFHVLFERLARVREVVIYALSPCEGFWEDVDARDPGPLHLWGRPGREHVRGLNALAGFDHEDRFADPVDRTPGAPTLLARLQSDILHRRCPELLPDPKRRLPGDDSLVVLEHASIRRELEGVASDIWRLIANDETLRFDEIAIVVPDSELAAYSSQLPTVFREAHDLPCRVMGGAGSAGGVVEAIELLLALPYGRFSRQELLRAASHPLIAPPEADPDRWASWCEGLGIVHGADRSDHEGTYVTRDILSWDQGLKRLALGSFMAGDVSEQREPFELEGQSYVPLEVGPSEVRAAAAFGLLLRSLVEDGRFARRAELSLGSWSRFLRTFVESYVSPANQAEEEELARALRCLHRLVESDLGERPVRYRVAAELGRARLRTIMGRSQGEGVALSTLGALRPLPFRVVFACGLGEGRFPSSEPDDALDLRWVRRREADVTPREADRYAFLELLVTTRDRLALSYVSRDTVTGQRLAPSSVVQELLHTLSLGYVDDVDELRRRHPLRRWAPAYFPDLFPRRRESEAPLDPLALPEARAEARTLALREDLEMRGDRATPEEVLARAEGDPAWAELARHLLLAPLPEVPVDARARVFMPLYALVKFLEFPLQAWARFRLGLDEKEEDDTAAREHELFETDFRDETLFLRKVLLGARAPGKALAEAYDEAARERELRGSGPSGAFARAERSDHLRILEMWRDELASRGVTMEGIEVHRFGRGGLASLADRAHEALVLDADYTDRNGVTRVVKVELAGATLPLGADRTVSLTLAKRAAPQGVWAKADRAQLRAFVDHAVLSASGVTTSQPHDSLSILATPEGLVPEHASFGALTRDEAAGWLRGMVRDLLAGPHAYFLPCEAVLVHAAGDAGEPLAARLAEAQSKLRDSDGPLALRSAYGPVPHPDEYPLPDEASARAMVERRFGLFFSKRRSSQ
jgi:exodeoxyribonuclease V gamma subunit